MDSNLVSTVYLHARLDFSRASVRAYASKERWWEEKRSVRRACLAWGRSYKSTQVPDRGSTRCAEKRSKCEWQVVYNKDNAYMRFMAYFSVEKAVQADSRRTRPAKVLKSLSLRSKNMARMSEKSSDLSAYRQLPACLRDRPWQRTAWRTMDISTVFQDWLSRSREASKTPRRHVDQQRIGLHEPVDREKTWCIISSLH